MKTEISTSDIYGSGGGKGGGSTFREDENTLRANAIVKVIEVISEGPIKGIKGGAKGIFLNDTPLQNADGSFNFGGKVAWDQRVGLPSQPFMPGFESAASEVVVNTEITKSSSVTKSTSSGDVDSMRVTIALPEGLYLQNTGANSLTGSEVELKIEKKLQSSGTWITDRQFKIEGKTTSPYEESVRVSRPGTSGIWDVRVSRITDDNASSLLRNNTFWSRLTEIQEVKLEYDDTAYYGLAVDAKSAGSSSIPVRSALVEGLLIKVPSNYNPTTRVNTGVWNGEFKVAFSNNPAWVLYDLIAHPRYGMGEWITEDQIDRYSFYDAAAYCDQLVPDGTGGTEPRYTFDAVLFQREEALNLVQKVASAMHAKVVWLGGYATVVQDRPSDWVTVLSKANVYTDAGSAPPFTYSSSTLQERTTAVHVTWSDPNDQYLPRVSTVEASTDAIERYGYNSTDIAAFGATSEGQAIRHGKHQIESVLNQLEIVTFKMSYEGFALTVGDVVKILDEDYAGVQNGGRLLAGSTTTSLKLDRPATLTPGSTIDLVRADGTRLTRTITQGAGTYSTVTVSPALTFSPAEYTSYVITTAIAPRQFRITKISQEDTNLVSIQALQYDPSKYSRIDTGADVPAPVFSANPDGMISAPLDLVFRETSVNQDNTIKRSLLVSWQRPMRGIPVEYIVQYQHNKGGWVSATSTSNSFEITNALAGTYEVRVTATSFSGVVSSAAAGSYTIVVTGGAASALNAPTSLVEQITGSTTAFTGTDLNFKWTNPTSNSSVLSTTLRDFQVRIIETTGSTTVRTVYVDPVPAGSTQSFSYTYSMNVADGGPRRTVQVQVRCRDTSGNLSSAVSATFTNVAPAVPSGISVAAGVGSNKLTFTNPTDPDFKGVLVWRGTSSGFALNSSSLVFDTTSDYIADGSLTAGQTYCYKLAAYDVFAKSDTGAGMNVSSQLSATPVGVGIASGTTNPTTGTEGDLFFNTTDGKLYRRHSGAWTAAVPTVDLTGQITSTQITDDAITTPKLAAGAVTANEIATNAVTSDKVLANAITTGKLLASAVTADKLATNSVTSDKIISNAITTDKIAAGTVTANKINGYGLQVMGGSFTGWAWPAAGQSGFYLGPNGLLIGNHNNGSWIQLNQDGSMSAPQFSISGGNAYFGGQLQAASGTFAGNLSAAGGTFSGNLSAAGGSFSGSLTASAVNAVNTINIAGNAVTVAISGSGSQTARTGQSTTSRTTSVIIGSITTAANGSGRVSIWLSPSGLSSVPEWGNYFILGECTLDADSPNVLDVSCTRTFRITRNGVAIPGYTDYHVTGVLNNNTATYFNKLLLIHDTPGPGVTVTYRYEINSTSSKNINHVHQVVAYNYLLLETKK